MAQFSLYTSGLDFKFLHRIIVRGFKILVCPVGRRNKQMEGEGVKMQQENIGLGAKMEGNPPRLCMGSSHFGKTSAFQLRTTIFPN